MDEKFEELIASFINNQVGISDQFLTDELSASLQNNLLNLDIECKMVFANIGNQLLKDTNQKKRGDKICWIEKETTNDAERIFLNRIEALESIGWRRIINLSTIRIGKNNSGNTESSFVPKQ
jgi:hypothetical protein